MNRPPIIARGRRSGVVAVLMFAAVVVTAIVVNAVRSIRPKQTLAETATAAAASEEHARVDRNRTNAAENRSWASAFPPLPQSAPTVIEATAPTPKPENLAALRRDAAARLDASGADARKALAELLEAGMLSQGRDMRIEARGKGWKHLKITYLLANRPFVFQEMHDQDFIASVRTVGFEEITFTDGHDFSEGYTLTRGR